MKEISIKNISIIFIVGIIAGALSGILIRVVPGLVLMCIGVYTVTLMAPKLHRKKRFKAFLAEKFAFVVQGIDKKLNIQVGREVRR